MGEAREPTPLRGAAEGDPGVSGAAASGAAGEPGRAAEGGSAGRAAATAGEGAATSGGAAEGGSAGRAAAAAGESATPVDVVPATPDTWDALADLFARRGGGDARFCWCAWWRLRAKDFGTPAANRDQLRLLVQSGPPPGLVALEDGRAIGWVGLGPRVDFERLERSRVIPRVNAPMPWSVVCFVIDAAARGRGVASALLRAAVEHARASGAIAVEGYPVDLAAARLARVADTGVYTGTRTMFERAGFRLASSTTSVSAGAPRVVMRLDLG